MYQHVTSFFHSTFHSTTLFLPFHPVMQSGRPDLLPKTFLPSEAAGNAAEAAVSSSVGNVGIAPTSQDSPQSQAGSRSAAVDLNNTSSKDKEHSTPKR